MTKEEKKLIEKLKSGKLDGQVGSDLYAGKSRVYTTISGGKIQRKKQGPGGKFFNGKENERFDGKLQILMEWTTALQQLDFLRKYGWLINDDDAKAYSAKFKKIVKCE